MLSNLYDYVAKTLKTPMDFKDILRSQIVYSVSAFDKLIHDLVRRGMVEIFIGRRQPTQKYLSENISLDLYQKLIVSTTIPPKEFLFEQEVLKKLKTVRNLSRQIKNLLLLFLPESKFLLKQQKRRNQNLLIFLKFRGEKSF